MAGGVIVNGQKTVFPDVYVTPEFANLQSRAAGAGTVALVGSYPFLEKNVAYLSTNQTAFELLSPRDTNQLKLSNLLWNPSDDSRVPGVPTGVYLFNIDTTTQAQAYLQDTTPANTVLLQSKIWGPRGNLTVVTLESETIGGKAFTHFTASNNGVTLDNFRVAGDDNVLTLTYLNPSTVSGNIAKGFTDPAGLGVGGSGDVLVAKSGSNLTTTFSTSVPEAAVDDSGAVDTWRSIGPVNGTLTVNFGAASTISGATPALMVEITGTVAGVTVIERLKISKADVEAQTPTTSTTSWTGPITVKCYPVDVGTGAAGVPGTAGTPANAYSGGVVTFSGSVFPTMNTANGQQYASDVITYVSIYGDYGFTASTGSSKASETEVASLDTKVATTIVGGLALGATAYRLVEAINANSVLCEASQVLQTAVDTSPALTVPLAGGTRTAGGNTEYTDCLETSSWYDIDAIVPMSDSAAVHALFETHVDYMSGVGANERALYVGATADETLSALLTRSVNFNNERVTFVCEQAGRVTYNGATVTLEPYEYAALLAAWEVGNFGTPLTGKNPGITQVYRNSSLATRDAQEQAIAGGINITVVPPGRGPELKRHVTTYTATEDASRTEASAMRSTFRTCRAVRTALRVLVGSGSTSATKGTIESTVQGCLNQLVQDKVIQSWVPGSLAVTQYADRWQVRFTYSPSYPLNFILVTPVVSIPVG